MKLNFFLLGALLSTMAYGQTGQALIANPLLSPDKMKEVKRQIMEAGHQELAQPKFSAPPNAQSGAVAGMPIPSIPSDFSQPPSVDSARRALASLRVMAIVGGAALVVLDTAAATSTLPSLGPMAGGQMPTMGLPGGMQPSGGQGQSQATQNNTQLRRTSATTLRHRVPAYVEGITVIPVIQGETVRLLLPNMPKEPVFVGTVLPAMYSPPTSVQSMTLEKPSSEYLNANRPDSTSMGPTQNTTPGNQQNNGLLNTQNQYPSTTTGNNGQLYSR